MSQKKFRRLEGCEIKSMRPIFETKMLIYQSKANLDGKVLFGKITLLEDPKIRDMPVRGLYGNREFHIQFWSRIYVAIKLTLSVSEIEF